ncbi:TRAP transporter large permease [Bradyrhizobium cenepequi]|uniref:TRAP transporter large permease n=1 Tax=Bradyrhizobium cenepequi TaxID=2821403 RepID=UPI001CE2DD68|nr:TRAP transporter large permease subunit [Bradyrhizobium cenepequi]MCA6108445.1 TRAP transporter large permease subunit [Bradyrhizobium cenepequi]
MTAIHNPAVEGFAGAPGCTGTSAALDPGRAWICHGVNACHAIAKTSIVVALVSELVIVILDVSGRTLFSHSFLWSDEAAKLALSIIAFMGGAVAYREDRHAAITLLIGLLPARWQQVVLVAVEWIVAIVCSVTAWLSLELLETHWGDFTPMLQISTSWYFVPLTVGMALIALYGLERLILRHSLAVVILIGAISVAIGIVFSYAAPISYLMQHPVLSLTGMIVLFFTTVLMGLPVSFAMLLATLIYLLATDTAPPVAAPQNMVDGTSNFILLALPFFLFAGVILERGGIGLRLVRFALALVGHLKGGLLQVIVVTIYLVSGISGSKVADVAAVGSIVRDELRKQRYTLEEGAAVLAASAAMAETIPPSIAMLVLGSVTSVSIGTLFVAGLLPAAVIALCLMVLIAFLSWRRADAGDQRPKRESWGPVLFGALLPLAMPVAMVIGIRFGIATPTEVSSFAVLYGIVLATLVYREMGFADLLRHVASSAAMAGVVLFVISSASSFAWVLSAANLPQGLVTLLHGSSPVVFMLGSIALLIVVGALLEGLPAIIILAPLLLPIAVREGFDAVQYAIVLILAMGIGAFMPPIGIGFYVAVAVAGGSLEGSARAMLPYLVVLVAAVVLVAFVPQITLIAPRLLGQ